MVYCSQTAKYQAKVNLNLNKIYKIKSLPGTDITAMSGYYTGKF